VTLPPPLDWRTAGIGPEPELPPERRVTRENWRTWPYMRWSFQHARELAPSRALPRAVNPRALPVELADLAFDWPGFLGATYTDALILLHRGRIVFEHYANGMTPGTPHMAFSITKSMIGLVAERLIALGLLDPESPAERHVPELAQSGFAGVSLRHLLDMTDGVAFDEDYANPDADVHRYSGAYWGAAGGGTLTGLRSLTARSAEAGASFRYRTPVADALGLVLRRATGTRLSDLVAEHVWFPAGCADEAYMLVDTAGMEISGTGLNATARDLARVCLWLMESGQTELRAALMTGGDRDLFAQASTGRGEGSYRSFWWIDHADPPLLAANGVFGQRMWIDSANQLAMVRFGSHPVASNLYTEELHRTALAAIRAALA
ncbi:MAG: serine hydrolase domain-containing protein, partial [Sphingomonas sp.]